MPWRAFGDSDVSIVVLLVLPAIGFNALAGVRGFGHKVQGAVWGGTVTRFNALAGVRGFGLYEISADEIADHEVSMPWRAFGDSD